MNLGGTRRRRGHQEIVGASKERSSRPREKRGNENERDRPEPRGKRNPLGIEKRGQKSGSGKKEKRKETAAPLREKRGGEGSPSRGRQTELKGKKWEDALDVAEGATISSKRFEERGQGGEKMEKFGSHKIGTVLQTQTRVERKRNMIKKKRGAVTDKRNARDRAFNRDREKSP